MVGMELLNRNGFVGKAESSKELLASGVEIMLTNDHKQLLIVLRSQSSKHFKATDWILSIII